MRAFYRPYVRHTFGVPTTMSFDLTMGIFELDVDRAPAIDAPTVVFVPALHYPEGCRVEVSAGTARHAPACQLLEWATDRAAGRVRLRLPPG